MIRTALDALITRKSLDFLHVSDASSLLDSPHIADQLPLKNVCAKVAPELSDEIDNLVGLLGITKRTFLEAAFLDALAKSKAIMRQEGVFDAMGEENRYRLKVEHELFVDSSEEERR